MFFNSKGKKEEEEGNVRERLMVCLNGFVGDQFEEKREKKNKILKIHVPKEKEEKEESVQNFKKTEINSIRYRGKLTQNFLFLERKKSGTYRRIFKLFDVNFNS